MKKIIEYAHHLLDTYLKEEDVAIDMTIGNGKDTLFLSSRCKWVYGFDIQESAIENTKELLKQNAAENVTLYRVSHEHVLEYILCPVQAVIFNLGYLPGGDKQITTLPNTTCLAIQNALSCLKVGGIMVIVCYPGHTMGLKEAKKVLDFAKNLSQQQYEVLQYAFINQMNHPPFIVAIERK